MRGVLIDAPPPPATTFDATRPWRLHEQVALRPERFGALAYHFGTRRLSFIKDHGLLAVVRALGDHDDVAGTCAAVGITPARVATIEHALATLAASHMITPRDPAAPTVAPGDHDRPHDRPTEPA